MRTSYCTTNPLDRVFLGVASLVIVAGGMVSLYHSVVTSIASPPYQDVAVLDRQAKKALPTNAAEESASPLPIAERAQMAIVR